MDSILNPILSGAAITVSISSFGYILDGKITDQAKCKLTELLKASGPHRDTTELFRLFLLLYSRLFGNHKFARPNVFRSVFMSTLVLIGTSLIWYTITPARLGAIIDELRGEEITPFVLIVVSINYIGDFFSLWQSRCIVELMHRADRFLGVVAFLFIDFIFSIAIFIAAMILALFFLWLLEPGFREPHAILYAGMRGSVFWGLWKDIAIGFFVKGEFLFPSDGKLGFSFLAILFYSTMFTSIWVWSFVLGYAIWPLLSFLRSVLDIEKYPVGSSMTIGGVFLGLGTAAVGYFL